jgi:pyridinium-3,5-biscarboxylic acid mononucleotide sulfurtransferase
MLKEMEGVLVAFSGGVDSTLLLAAAQDALGDAVLAVTAASPTFPAQDFEFARKTASRLGVRWTVLETNELDDHQFRTNPPNRCYFCKRKLFSLLLEKAKEEALPIVIEGTNADDLSDFRPGLAALSELGIRSPFLELGIGKQEIRRLARELRLENWDKPSSACLASRIPYGEEITKERLNRIAGAEALLRKLGFRQVRVRDHGSLARIELVPDDLDQLLEPQLRETIVKACKQAGYNYVTLDLQGYRTGSLNETLRTDQRQE